MAGGACVAVCVAGGHAWQGGVRGTHTPTLAIYHEIRSMGGRYASYWNAFLFKLKLQYLSLILFR